MKSRVRHVETLALLFFANLAVWKHNTAVAVPNRSHMSGGTTSVPIPLGEDPILCAADPAQLLRCQTACASGGMAIRNFCNSLPDPRMKAGCFALELGSETACRAWCYWHFGK